MTGRDIDQVRPHPSQPFIPAIYMRDARGYVNLAEQTNGLIPRPISFEYIWGDAIALFEKIKPDLRLINLETSITQCDDYWPGKGVNYRMHLNNTPCLTAAHVDCCCLANNHSVDWGYAGLRETLESLEKAHIKTAGAGLNPQAAKTPAVMEILGKGRAIVFAWGSETSGLPLRWLASEASPGINLLPDLSEHTVQQIRDDVELVKQPQDIVVASIYWGGNWGYTIPDDEIAFAHNLSKF